MKPLVLIGPFLAHPLNGERNWLCYGGFLQSITKYVLCLVLRSFFIVLFFSSLLWTTFSLPTPFSTMSVVSFGIHSYILACLVKFCCRLVFGVALQRLLTSRFSSYSSLETDWRTYVNIATRRLPLYHGLVYWSITRLSNKVCHNKNTQRIYAFCATDCLFSSAVRRVSRVIRVSLILPTLANISRSIEAFHQSLSSDVFNWCYATCDRL